MASYIDQPMGNYRIQQLVGKGGFAEVYLATHMYLKKRQAAIKILHATIDSGNRKQFCREAEIVGNLRHRHIINVLDFGIHNQTPYLVMDYLPRGSLRTHHPQGTRLPLDQVVAYTKQIALALEYAHTQHVIHQDVKPANILLNEENEAVLSDFGLAILTQSMISLSTQNPAGTPCYMAPEQIRGKPCAASDQYALAIMVYAWLCGTTPFHGPVLALYNQHLHITPPGMCGQAPGLSTAVESVVLRALSKEPGDRFPHIQAFAFALEQAALLTNTPLISQNGPSTTGESTQPMSETPSPYQPAQAGVTATFLPNAEEIDNQVMKLLCDTALANGHYWVTAPDLVHQAEAMNIPAAEFFDSLRILRRKGYLELKEAFGGHVGLLKVRTLGFERYARRFVAHYQELAELVKSLLENEEMRTNTALVTHLQQPELVIEQILHRLAEEGLIDLTETLGNKENIRVNNISPELKQAGKVLQRYPHLPEGRSLLGLSMSNEVQEYFSFQLHPGTSPQVLANLGGPVTPMYYTQLAQSHHAPAPPTREAIQWLEEALQYKDDPDGQVTASLALMYGYDGDYERMIDTILRARTVNSSLIAYFQRPENLMMLLYACHGLASVEEVMRKVRLKLPALDEVQQALREASDLTKNPYVLAQPYIEWYAVECSMGSAVRMPVKVRIAFPNKHGVTYASVFKHGQAPSIIPPQPTTTGIIETLMPVDEILTQLTDKGVALITLV
jgi:tRNA A-37 threonylcarbamoyl transferase component Bud32